MKKNNRRWIVNGDHIRQVLVKHDRAQQRLREDLKFERRPMGRVEKADNADRCLKFRNRVSSFLAETAAHTVGYAVRRQLARIVVNTTYRDYFGHFPWHRFEQQLRHKADENNIQIEFASDKDKSKS